METFWLFFFLHTGSIEELALLKIDDFRASLTGRGLVTTSDVAIEAIGVAQLIETNNGGY